MYSAQQVKAIKNAIENDDLTVLKSYLESYEQDNNISLQNTEKLNFVWKWFNTKFYNIPENLILYLESNNYSTLADARSSEMAQFIINNGAEINYEYDYYFNNIKKKHSVKIYQLDVFAGVFAFTFGNDMLLNKENEKENFAIIEKRIKLLTTLVENDLDITVEDVKSCQNHAKLQATAFLSDLHLPNESKQVIDNVFDKLKTSISNAKETYKAKIEMKKSLAPLEATSKTIAQQLNIPDFVLDEIKMRLAPPALKDEDKMWQINFSKSGQPQGDSEQKYVRNLRNFSENCSLRR